MAGWLEGMLAMWVHGQQLALIARWGVEVNRLINMMKS